MVTMAGSEYDVRRGGSLAAKVYEACYGRAAREAPRCYLGMSEIGGSCARALWLKYHGAAREPVSGHLARVFRQGHATEAIVIEDLREAGVEVVEAQREFSGFEGRFRGHCDGIARYKGEKFVLEIKSANNASYDKFVSLGVRSNQRYWGQVQCYMAFASVHQTLFVVENKNSQKLYTEIVPYDNDAALRLIDLAERIVTQREPDPKPQKADCFFCDVKNACESPELWPDLSGACWVCAFFRDRHTRSHRRSELVKELGRPRLELPSDLSLAAAAWLPEEGAAIMASDGTPEGIAAALAPEPVPVPVDHCGFPGHALPLKRIGSCGDHVPKEGQSLFGEETS
jgi:CRISPR/Cas system-associated exonuclease Cas4 (RecB family)